MGLYEIRDSFISNEGRSERMASFRDARVESIIKRKWPIPLGLANLYIIHLIPEFPIDRGLDAQDILRRRADFPLIWPNGPANAHFNADGVLFHDGTYDYTGSHCYCQVYRSGTIESVGPCAFLPTGEWNNIATVELEQNTLDSLSSYISGLADLGIDPPYHVFISLINVGGWVIFSGDPLHQRMPKIDREHILLPPVAIDGSETSLDAVLQSPFNWMWNAGGRARCPHYDEHGMLKRS